MAEHYDSNFDFWPIPDLPPGCIVSSEAAPKFKANEHDSLYAHALGVDLECDGIYWHRKLGRAAYDARRDAKLNDLGYPVIRLSSEEIEKGLKSNHPSKSHHCHYTQSLEVVLAIVITSAAVAKAPSAYSKQGYKIFLGGVIDMGKGEPWHETVIKALDGYDVTILSPKREDWDNSWEQSLHDERFVEQVEWELQAQEDSDLRLYVFASTPEESKKSKAPITLMELGLHASDNTVVVCPEGYFRKGNVEVVCRWFDIPIYPTLDELVADLKATLETMGLKSKISPDLGKA